MVLKVFCVVYAVVSGLGLVVGSANRNIVSNRPEFEPFQLYLVPERPYEGNDFKLMPAGIFPGAQVNAYVYTPIDNTGNISVSGNEYRGRSEFNKFGMRTSMSHLTGVLLVRGGETGDSGEYCLVVSVDGGLKRVCRQVKIEEGKG